MDEDGSGGGGEFREAVNRIPSGFGEKVRQLGVGTGFLCSADPTDSAFHFPKLSLLLESKVATTHGKNSAYSLDKTRLQGRLSHDQPLVTKKTINSNN